MSIITVGPAIKDGRVVHVEGPCKTCDGDGWVLLCEHSTMCNCGGQKDVCPACRGVGELWDEDCSCSGCVDLLTTLEAA